MGSIRLAALLIFTPVLAVALFFALGRAQDLPIFDAHLHYNRSDWAVNSPEAALAILDRLDVRWAVVSSTLDEVGSDRTLLVLCTAFRAKLDRYPNLTVKKIPKAVLSRCEWGHDDYSLRVENLPKAPPKPGQMDLAFSGGATATKDGGASNGG